ncbi:MAG: thiamine-phosphate kinase [Gemmatimonadetes bacterium]|nr:thiamine-phosphate kinase [Gemmatimonadota bacterium]
MGSIPLGPGPEFDLIRRFLGRPTQRDDVRVGPGDDCAVVGGDGIAVGADLAVEGVHFRRDWITPEEIGYRAAAASLSDLAAMAARPIGCLVALAIPESAFGDAPLVMLGAREAVEGSGGVLLGGDVARSPGPLTLDVVVVGEAPHPVLRTGARRGDEVWVTGELGAAAAAVRAWLRGAEPDPAARHAFARPVPRIAEALWLGTRGALHALIDLSDGLAGDATHLAAASGVSIVLEPETLPVSPAARAGVSAEEAIDLALAGGDDYELCFAAPPGVVEPLAGEFEKSFAVRLSRVGSVEAGRGVSVRRADGSVEPLRVAGYQHFRAGEVEG